MAFLDSASKLSMNSSTLLSSYDKRGATWKRVEVYTNFGKTSSLKNTKQTIYKVMSWNTRKGKND